MTARSTFRLSLALLGLTAFVPPTLAHAEMKSSAGSHCKLKPKKQTGMALDQRMKASSGLPKFKKVTGALETYNGTEQVYQAPVVRVDPVVGNLHSVPLGSTISIQKIGQPHAITLPGESGVKGELQRRADLPASLRKRVNRKYNREVAKQVAMAQNASEIIKIGPEVVTKGSPTNAAVPYSGVTVAVNDPISVPAKTPVDVVVKDKYNRTSTTRLELTGMQRNTTGGNWINENGRTIMRDLGGEHSGTMAPLMQAKNIRVSHPYMKSMTVPVLKADGSAEMQGPESQIPATKIIQRSVVKVLSLAAFAGNNAKITVTNRDTGESVPFTVSKMGAGAVEIPAEQKAALRITIEHAAVPGKSLAAKKVYDMDAPGAAKQAQSHIAYKQVAITEVE